MSPEFFEALASWDGKSAKDLDSIYQAFCTREGFDEMIFRWSENKEQQIALSACIKRHASTGSSFSVNSGERILPYLRQTESWHVLLNVFQSFEAFEIPESSKPQWEFVVRKGLQTESKFLRAWSYTAFAVLANHFPEYQDECLSMIDMALKDEPGSVVARIRQMKSRGLVDF